MAANSLSPDLLHAPAAHGARVVALGFLERANHARKQLADARGAAEVEAIHDFRVALRRLRSWLRSHRAVFDEDVPRKLRRNLRDLARATGACRDVDVQVEWITHERRSCTPRQRVGVSALLKRLDERRGVANDKVQRDIARDYERVRRNLETVFASYTTEVRADEHATIWSGELAPLVREHAVALRESLARVRTQANRTQAHEGANRRQAAAIFA